MGGGGGGRWCGEVTRRRAAMPCRVSTPVPCAGELTGKHLQKLMKFFDDVDAAERAKKQRRSKGKRTASQMLVSGLRVSQPLVNHE